MRVLLVSNPGIGHVNPMFPIARAIAEAGHEVAFATASSFCPLVKAEGFTAFPAGLDWSESEAELAFPELATLGLEERGSFLLKEVFADTAAHRMVPDLLVVARDWRANLILRNDYEFASCVVAEHLGVPQATISISFFMPPSLLGTLIGDQLVYLRSAYGLKPYPSTGMLYPHLYLTYAPPAFEPRVLPHMWGIQPATSACVLDGELPARLFSLPNRPLVYVSLGTVFNRNPRVFATILAGLRDASVNVIATIGRNQEPSLFGPQPSHILIERYIPQECLFRYASLFITHAPFYTAMSALRFGLPLLMIPQAGDQPAHALRLAHHGVGVILCAAEHTDPVLRHTAQELSPGTVHDAVSELLKNPRYHAAAAYARRQIFELPGPEHAVNLLEGLTRGNSANA